jgi:hypothetical protein
MGDILPKKPYKNLSYKNIRKLPVPSNTPPKPYNKLYMNEPGHVLIPQIQRKNFNGFFDDFKIPKFKNLHLGMVMPGGTYKNKHLRQNRKNRTRRRYKK